MEKNWKIAEIRREPVCSTGSNLSSRRDSALEKKKKPLNNHINMIIATVNCIGSGRSVFYFSLLIYFFLFFFLSAQIHACACVVNLIQISWPQLRTVSIQLLLSAVCFSVSIFPTLNANLFLRITVYTLCTYNLHGHKRARGNRVLPPILYGIYSQ